MKNIFEKQGCSSLKRILIFGFIASLLLGCVTGGKMNTKENEDVSHKSPEQLGFWFKGSVEDAFVLAKKENKILFLYWGAVWCPPCNELKEQVFSKPKFAEIMKTVVPVYLDGDTEAAQIWSEKLKAGGYPTIIALNSDRQEIMRIVESVSIEEFVAAFESAVVLSKPFKQIVEKAKNGKANKDEWRMISFFSWGDPSLGLKEEDTLFDLKLLLEKIPSHLKEERAMLSARFIEVAMSLKDTKERKISNEINKIKKDREKYLNLIFLSPQTKIATRAVIINEAKDIVEFFTEPTKPELRKDLIKKWLDAVQVIREDKITSTDTKLWSWYPMLQFHQLENPNSKIPKEMADKIRDAVSKADKEAKSSFDRHAVISDAAELLMGINDFDLAQKMLLKELETTDTPWYYQSVMANLEEKKGNIKGSLDWSEKARLSAKGRATRIQWIVADLVNNVKLKHNDQEQHIENLIKEYYEVALSMNDGFSGRNASRAKAVATNLKPWLEKDGVKKLVATYEVRCEKIANSDLRKSCLEHFKELKKN